MAYSEQLADRLRIVLGALPGLEERRMFGGLAFLLHGNMCCGVVGDTLCLRLGNERAAQALDEPHTRPMDFTGTPLRSMVYVDPAGYRTARQLQRWVDESLAFAASLPRKSKGKVGRRKKA